MYNLVKVMVIILLLLYPVFIYYGLNYFSPSQLGLCLLALFAVRIVFIRKRDKSARIQVVFTVLIGGSLALLTWVFDSVEYLKWYPVGLNMVFFFIFTASIIFPPSVIEQIARAHRNNLPPSGVIYTRNVTIIWSVFFIVNALISSATVFYGSLAVWTLYNGLISYIIMGLIFVFEITVRKYFVEAEP